MVTQDDIRAVLTSRALAAVTAARAEQAIRFGHTPHADLALAPDRLPALAAERLRHALDYLDRHNHRLPPQNKRAALRKIEVAAALLIAAWDRIDAEPEEGL